MKHLAELPPFQYFGSGDSQDIDLVFFIETMPLTITECADKCAIFSESHQMLFVSEKKVNSNLVILRGGILTDTFKGNTDELNNALFLTYHLHQQYYPNHIKQLLPRDMDLKFLRAARSILSFLTKTAQREEIKKALRGDIFLKLEVLEKIELSDIDWSNTKMSILDVKKSLAFQIGQTLALFCEQEVCTKTEIGLIFPQLKPYLNRELETDFIDLQSSLVHFTNALKSKISTMKSRFEYKYQI